MEPLFEDNFVNLHKSAHTNFWKIAPLERVSQDNHLVVPMYNGDIFFDCAANELCEAQIFYDSLTLRPYEIAVWDSNRREGYRWVHPAYSRLRRSQLDKVPTAAPKCLAVDVDVWYETESIPDILNKIDLISQGLEHDHKVVIVLDFDEDSYAKLVKAAELQGVSRDEFIEESIRKEITKLDKKAFPNGYPEETGVDNK